MSYIGNTPTTQSFISGTDYFNGTGSQTAFTLSRTVASINDIQVTVNNVVQQPNDAYTISGTTLTMTSAPSAGTNNVYVRYLSTTTQAITPSQNTVSWNTLDSNIQQDLGVMFKNRIINGAMTFDQRNAGASISIAASTPATYFPVDRWYGQQTGAAITAQRVAGSGSFQYATRLTGASGNSTSFLSQRIESFNCWNLTSQSVTLSAQLSRSSGTTCTWTAYYAGSSDNFSSVTVIATGSFTLTSTPTTYSATFNAGANAKNGMLIEFAFGALGAGVTVDITGVQLEVGTQATAFSTAGGSYGAELQLCQRYFQAWLKGTGTGSLPYWGTSGGGTTGVEGPFVFLQQMRTAPTYSINALELYDGGASTYAITAIINYGSSNQCPRLGFSATGLTTNRLYYVLPVNSTAYFFASAEL